LLSLSYTKLLTH